MDGYFTARRFVLVRGRRWDGAARVHARVLQFTKSAAMRLSKLGYLSRRLQTGGFAKALQLRQSVSRLYMRGTRVAITSFSFAGSVLIWSVVSIVSNRGLLLSKHAMALLEAKARRRTC